ncbi:MAG: hypothetical protein PHC35_01780 [Deltaproteobacteria bacterium]|nr:hypothetical protein [Deltaproteobacteria bacterium]
MAQASKAKVMGLKQAKIVGKDGVEKPCPKKLAALAHKAIGIKREYEYWREQLEAINTELKAALEPELAQVQGMVAIDLDDDMRVCVGHRWSYEITDPDAIKVVLGERYIDLVRERLSVKPEKRLIDMLTSGDDPIGMRAREYVAVKDNIAITYVIPDME